MPSTVTNAKNFKISLGEFIQPGAISGRGSVLYRALVAHCHLNHSLLANKEAGGGGGGGKKFKPSALPPALTVAWVIWGGGGGVRNSKPAL